MTVPPAIVARELTRRFLDLVAVDALSFEVHPGELFGIVGPDGAGKTTTLRMLAGVLRPTSGDAELDGVSLRRRETVKARIAYMPQRFGLYGDLTVDENLDFYAELYRVPRTERRARRERLFEFSGLAPFAGRLAGKLSGGMKQKLALSCALIHQPRILLLDEPTFGVDPISRRELWVIIHERVAAGTTAVVSTSYLDEAERFDRLALLDHGRAVALDSPDALRYAFRGELLAVRARGARTAQAVCAAVPGVRRAIVFGDLLHLTVESADAATGEVERALARAGIEIERIDRIRPTLEDVFIERVGSGEAA